MFRAILIACLLVAPALGHSVGAPNAVCTNGLRVGHHADPQTGEAPYSFSGENAVKSGEKIKITLSGDDFLGYVLQAQDDKQEPIGTFKILEDNKSQLLTCSAEGDTLTHVQFDKKPITSVEFEWLAPADYKGNVKFVATVVKNYKTFWERKVTKDVTVE
ncbi:defense protein l(2)34Fc-like [Calliphora vicina]|uniref:defense protein l(2)34Fc-like n=1 Tax=Calliphora vicina TaxID=7373 RepID=UPI00325A6CDD